MRKIYYLLIVLLTFGIYTACDVSTNNPDETEIISGFIIDEAENPVTDASVSLASADSVLIASDTTDSEGYFQILGSSKNVSDLMIKVEHSGFEDIFITLSEFKSKQNTEKQFKLKNKLQEGDCCNSLVVDVSDSSGNKLNDVEIRLNQGEEVISKKYTDSTGIVEFENLCDGNYWIRIDKDGFKVKEIEFSLSDCDSLYKAIVLEEKEQCCNYVKFIIKDEDGNPINDVEGKLTKSGELIGKKYSGQNGIIEFENLCDGKYFIRLAKEGYKVIEEDFTVDNCEEKTIAFILQNKEDEECCNVIRVFVSDTEENPLKGAEIRLNKGEQIIEKLYSNIEGYVIFDGVCDGNYWIRIAKEGFEVKEFEFNISDCDSLFKNIKLVEKDQCCNILKIKVKNQENEYIKNAQVKLTNESGFKETLNTNGDGVVTFDGLCDGYYWIRIAKDGYKVIEYKVKVDNCETKIEEFTLEGVNCCNNVLRIYPKDSESGEMIPYGKIKLWKNGELIETANVGENGAVIDGICKGSYWVDVIAEGYESIEFEITFDCEQVKEIVKELTPDNECCNGIIKVIAKDSESGERITNGYIKIWKNGQVVEEAELNNDGVAIVDGLCEGKYGIDIFAEGYNHKEFSVELGCNETKEIVKELTSDNECCNGIIKVIAKDSESGERITNGYIKIWKNGQVVEEAALNNDGVAIVDGLCEGKYGIDIFAEGYKHKEFSVELGCNETKEIVKELEKELCCNNKAIIIPKDSESGEILNGAKVRLWKNGEIIKTKIVENGRAVMEEICKGAYGVSILMENYNTIEFEIEFNCEQTKEIVKELTVD